MVTGLYVRLTQNKEPNLTVMDGHVRQIIFVSKISSLLVLVFFMRLTDNNYN